MRTPQQVWEEAYPDRRRWDELEQETKEEWGRVVRIAQWQEPFASVYRKFEEAKKYFNENP